MIVGPIEGADGAMSRVRSWVGIVWCAQLIMAHN